MILVSIPQIPYNTFLIPKKKHNSSYPILSESSYLLPHSLVPGSQILAFPIILKTQTEAKNCRINAF